MRNHDIPTIHMPEQPADNISLLIGAEANRERRRSSQISTAQSEPFHRRVSLLFSETDRSPDSDGDEDEESAEPKPSFLGRMHSYQRQMHQHTKSQMESPATGTVPSYNKTMRAFTFNQFHYQRMTKSETSSPHLGVRQALFSPKIRSALSKLDEDGHPQGPCNTPDRVSPMTEDVHGIDFRKLARRSVTEPTIARDFAEAKRRSVGDAAL